MNMREVARALGVTYDQVYRLIWAGRLRGEKVDGKWRIEQASVEEYKAQRRCTQHPYYSTVSPNEIANDER